MQRYLYECLLCPYKAKYKVRRHMEKHHMDAYPTRALMDEAQGLSGPVYLISPLNESDTSAPSGGSPPGFPKNRLLAQYTNLSNLKVM